MEVVELTDEAIAALCNVLFDNFDRRKAEAEAKSAKKTAKPNKPPRSPAKKRRQ